jgi:nitrogen fixation/metabolism regulation signal transduction histidine kinase
LPHRTLTLLLGLLAVVTVAACLLADLPWPTRWLAAGGTALVYGVVIRLLRKSLGGQEMILTAVADGIASLRDRDYSISVTLPDGDTPMRRMVEAYNSLGDRLRSQRQDLYQRELLLDTVIQASPLALVLTNATGTILYGNLAARQLFLDGRKLEGCSFNEVLRGSPAALREAVLDERDTLFTAELHGEAEVFHLSQRRFLLNGQPHRLRLLKQLTREVNAQEVATWKRVIRVIAHEINNSVAPIASLAQSGQRLAQEPDEARLKKVFGAIEERMSHLAGFVDAYSRFAKLPRPRIAAVDWRRFLDSLHAVSAFTLDDLPPTSPGYFDESQLEQVLINLLRNAAEAGSPAPETRVHVVDSKGGFRVEVSDRGSGMSDEVLTNALLPFYSTKPTGTGLGLTLCREIVEAHGGTLEISRRPGGGVTVTIWLPPFQGFRSSVDPDSTQIP